MLIDLYFGNGRLERYTVSKFDITSENAPCTKFCRFISSALGALCTNAAGDSGDLNEWLLPAMKEHGIKDLRIRYEEDFAQSCEITQNDQEQLATNFHFDSQFLEIQSLAELERITHTGKKNKLVFIECEPETIGLIQNHLALKFSDDDFIYFFFNVFGNAVTFRAHSTSYF